MRRYKSTILAISTREKEAEKHSDAMLLELSEAKKENRSKNGFSFAIQYLLERWRNVLLHRVLVGKLTLLQESLTASEKKGNIVNTCTVCMNVGSVYANVYTYAMYSYNSCMYGRLYLYVEPIFLFLNVWCILASLWIRVTELRAVRVPAANSRVAQEQQDRAWSQGTGVQVCLDVLVICVYRIALQLLFTSTSTLSYLLSLLPFSATIAQSNFAGKQVAKPSSSIIST